MFVPLTVADFLDRALTGFSNCTAIVDEPDQPAMPVPTTTYREFGARVRAWQAGLDALNVDPGARVAVVSHNSARLMELLHAVPGTGRICVPINFRLRAHEVQFIVEHSDADVLFVDPELDPALRDVGAKHRFVLGDESDAMMRFDTEPRPWAEPHENATATINYTSGTTASPKGVQLTHRNVWINALTLALHLRAWERDVLLHTLPMFHCNGWGMPYAAVGLGIKNVVLRKVDGAEILRRVEEHDVSLMLGAPAVWTASLDAAAKYDGDKPGRDRVRIVTGGAPPPSRAIQQITEELGWEFTQIYGLTESSPLLTFNRAEVSDAAKPAEERARLLSRAGKPTLGTRLRIDQDGQILARSNTVMAAYWNNPDATADAIQEGWFHTGDGGTIDDGGYLNIADRKKDVIITGGENVSSIEVEDALFSHPAVAEVAVIGVPSEKWGETIKALVVLKADAKADEAELIAHCKERLAGYKAPTSVEFRDAIPRTATGKIQKFKLREPYWQNAGGRQVNWRRKRTPDPPLPRTGIMLNISQDGRVQVIELAHGKVNALDLELLQAINSALAAADPSQALVLTGAGRAFCAGVDLRRLLAEDLDHTHAFLDALTDCFHRIYDHPAPVVAAVNGAAIAGGCIIAAAADRRLMSGGTIGLTEMAVGVPIPTVGIEIVRNVVGPRARDLVLSAKLMNPLEALSAGLVDVLVEAEKLREAAVSEAERLVAAPIEVVRFTKRQLQAPARERFPADRAQDEAATKQLWVSDSVRQTMADFMAALSAPAR